MTSVDSGKSFRARGVSGIAALVLVGLGVGTVYANTAPVAAPAGSSTSTTTSTSTGTSTGTSTSTGTKTGTKTGTGTGTGSGTGSLYDVNGVLITRPCGGRQVAAFSRSGRTISGTVVPTKKTCAKIKKKHGRHTVWAFGKRVGTFTVTPYGHLVFSTSTVRKNHVKVTFTFKIGSSTVATAKTPFKF